ncbi:MAG: InlB B-repeat-containing protein, partial [Lachnospiraceae bacterium]|nr:InlB B-repeat-containing protein [Lachnospiraceae bacterium]
MLKKFKTVLTIACMAFVFLVMNAKAYAYTGTGTEEDPYVVYTYEEFVNLTRENEGLGMHGMLVYYKLGQDIESKDSINEDFEIRIGGRYYNTYPSFMHLDLAGHMLSRRATTVDRGMFYLYQGVLEIDDSVGGGGISCNMTGNGWADLFYLDYKFLNTYYDESGVVVDLIINAGEFSAGNGNCISCGGSNANITINGGTFLSPIDNISYSGSESGVPTNISVYGGTFKSIRFGGIEKDSEQHIYDCTINGRLFTHNGYLKPYINPDSTIVANGKEYTASQLYLTRELTGSITITDPNKPRITQNLESYTFPYLGAEHAFSITVDNAEGGTWYVVDEENNRYTSDYIMEQGWADVAFKKSGNTHKIVFSNVTADLDGMKVYCKIKGGGYTITSDSAEIHVAKKVKDVSAEIANLNKAVAGRSANAFTSVKLWDFNGCGASYQSGSAQWYTSDGTLFEGKLEEDELMTLRIGVDLADGYEFANDASCTVKKVGGSDLTATRVGELCTATHAVFEFSYLVPAAKDWSFSRYGVKITNGMGLTVNDPLERPALNATYSATVTDWRPGKYVLLRPSIPSSDQELDHWDVTVQFVVLPILAQGNPSSATYSYDDTLYETFFSEIDPTKLSANDQAAVKAACNSDKCMVSCVINLTAVFRDKPIMCVVSFDANGGEGTMGNKRVNPFEKYLLPACKFTWEGHDFIGWTVNDGTEVYEPGSSITVAGNVTLHAQWRNSVCLIMVDLGTTSEQKGEVEFDGTVKTAFFYEYGSIVTLKAIPFAGYEFKQWEEDGKGIYSLPNYTFAVQGDRILTPTFTEKAAVRIFFDANGGEGTMTAQTIPYGTAYTLPECGFTFAGMTFTGWKIDGDDALHQPGENMEFVRDVTLVAQYQDEFIFVDENLAVAKKSLTLFDTITIDFKVPAEALADYHNPYLMVTQNGTETKLTEYREDGGLLIFSYRVAPHQMGDAVTAVPHALNVDGRDVTGAEFTYSVAEYCYNMLNKEDYQTAAYAKLRRLLVDILLYGDAAQNY